MRVCACTWYTYSVDGDGISEEEGQCLGKSDSCWAHRALCSVQEQSYGLSVHSPGNPLLHSVFCTPVTWRLVALAL